MNRNLWGSLITAALAACTPTIAPAPNASLPPVEPTQAPARLATPSTATTATQAPTSLALSTPTPVVLPASPTPVSVAAVEVTCPSGEPWSGTQAGLTLFLCFDPSPPRLGIRGTYEAIPIAESGQPLLGADVVLKMVGGMAGMEGEHDEAFSLELIGEAGRYSAQATVGPTDLVLTGIEVTVRHDRQLWAFSIKTAELPSESP